MTKVSLENLHLGDHLCCIYETEDQRLQLLVELISSGLERNEKTLCIVEAPEIEPFLRHYRDLGANADLARAGDRLALFSWDEAGAEAEVLDPDKGVEFVRAQTNRALADGFAGVRIIGKMPKGAANLLEYETRLDAFFPRSMALGICQYDQRQFSLDTLTAALELHPRAALDAQVMTNPYYVRPNQGCRQSRKTRELRHRLQYLRLHQAVSERALQAQKFEQLRLLAGGVAHDMNNLLTGVLGNAELALAAPSLPAARGTIDKIIAATQYATALSKQMLACVGSDAFVVGRLDLSALVEGVAQFVEPLIDSGVELKLDLARDLPSITGDATQIRQVIMNLITNAADAIGDEGGTITATVAHGHGGRPGTPSPSSEEASCAGGCVSVQVRDTGCGITQETRKSIFEPFFTTKPHGRGLGLAATRAIVHGHNGTITVDSLPGKGTAITVCFPAVTGPDPVSTCRASPAVTGERRVVGAILIVDDEEIVRAVVSELVATIGCVPLTAPDGHEAIRLFREHLDTISLVLLDLDLPGVSGEAVAVEILRIDKNARIVVTTGHGEHPALERLAGMGVDGVIRKPYGAAHLQETLRRVLGRDTRGIHDLGGDE